MYPLSCPNTNTVQGSAVYELVPYITSTIERPCLRLQELAGKVSLQPETEIGGVRGSNNIENFFVLLNVFAREQFVAYLFY